MHPYLWGDILAPEIQRKEDFRISMFSFKDKHIHINTYYLAKLMGVKDFPCVIGITPDLLFLQRKRVSFFK